MFTKFIKVSVKRIKNCLSLSPPKKAVGFRAKLQQNTESQLHNVSALMREFQEKPG